MNSQQLLLQTEKEISKFLAKQVQVLRVEKNLTQKEFAKKADISYGTYIKFERSGTISLEGFLKVLRHLGKLKEVGSILEIDKVQKAGIEEYMKSKDNEKKRASSKGLK